MSAVSVIVLVVGIHQLAELRRMADVDLDSLTEEILGDLLRNIAGFDFDLRDRTGR